MFQRESYPEPQLELQAYPTPFQLPLPIPQGSATTTVNVEFESSLSNPVISVGEILEITGRTAEIGRASFKYRR